MNNLRWPMVQKLQKWNEQNLVGDSIDRHAVGPSVVDGVATKTVTLKNILIMIATPGLIDDIFYRNFQSII